MKLFQILFLIFIFSVSANSQTAEKTVLIGTLYDSSGAIFPFTNVQIKNSKGEVVEEKSDKFGEFVIELQKGVFVISSQLKIGAVIYKSKETRIEIKDFSKIKQDLILYCTESEGGKCPVVTTVYCN